MHNYSPGYVGDLLGVTYRQLSYWRRTKLVVPSIRHGADRWYALDELVATFMVVQLRGDGFSIQELREVIPILMHGIRSAHRVSIDHLHSMAAFVSRKGKTCPDRRFVQPAAEFVMVCHGEIHMNEAADRVFACVQVRELLDQLVEDDDAEAE